MNFQAQAIKNLAKRVFDKLKTDPNRLKDKFLSKRSKKGRKPSEEAGSSSTKRGTKRKRRVGGSNDQIGQFTFLENFRIGAYILILSFRFLR